MPHVRSLLLRRAEPTDADAIRRAFASAFGASRADDEWRWRYERSPLGAHVAIACDADEVLAHYATLGAELVLDGERVRAGQAIDSFVVPRARTLGRANVFVELGRFFASEFGGAQADALVWGLPVRSAWRVGRRELGYETVRQFLKLAAPAQRSESTVETLDARPADVDELARRVVAERGVAFARDASWFAWRCSNVGSTRYEFGALRAGHELRALAIACEGEFDGERAWLVGEWLIERGDDEARRSLSTWARDRAARRGLARAVTHFAEIAPEFVALQRHGWRVEASRYPLVARSFDRCVDIDLLRERWFTTLADTDLFG